jgi:hypothetical protein
LAKCEHEFDDCKCCEQPDYCLHCGFTQHELALQEEVRKLKEQMRLRHEDYARTLSGVAQTVVMLWTRVGAVVEELDPKDNDQAVCD